MKCKWELEIFQVGFLVFYQTDTHCSVLRVANSHENCHVLFLHPIINHILQTITKLSIHCMFHIVFITNTKIPANYFKGLVAWKLC